MIDQRQTGMTKVGMTDKNGKRSEIYSINVAKIRGWIGLIMGIIFLISTVVGGVWAGVKFGVASEISDIVETMATDERGVIHQEIHQCAEEYLGTVRTAIADDFETMETKLTEQGELSIRLEERQEAMETKLVEWTDRVEQNHQEIMRWLRTAAAEGGSP